MKDEPLKICPECGKELRRLINGGTGVIFRGGGFYITDKSGKAGQSSSSSGSGVISDSSKTTETKTAGAASTGVKPEVPASKAANG
jgi:hypothetical protein